MKRSEKGFYVCEACGMAYKQEVYAHTCETWCKKNHSCNIEIIAHAINEDEQ